MEQATLIEDVTYVGTRYPIVAHILHPASIDRTRCGQRARWFLSDQQRAQMRVCYSCQQDLERERREARS
jgi:hypothetical protein